MNDRSARKLSGLALAVVVAGAAVAAAFLHRRGHLTGDDFALYINQARALFEGNIANVISDNRFLWENSTAVTPQMYPWGFPILLAPFVRFFGAAAYDRMAYLEVACLCAWLVLFHGIVRRRAGRIVALAIVALFATAPVYLVHTDQLLTEFPHMMVTAVVIWWLDRVMARHRLTVATTNELVTLGLLAVAAYNVRREGLALVAVIAAAQLVDVAAARRTAGAAAATTQWLRSLPWRTLLLPHAVFVAAAALFQFLLPSTLIPDNDNSIGNIPTRLLNLDARDYPHRLTEQLGLDGHPLLGLVLLGLAGAGALVACIRRPRHNVPLATLMLTTMLIVGTHFRMVERYYYQVTPLVVFFVTMLAVSSGELLARGRRRALAAPRMLAVLAVAPVLYVTAIHVWTLPSHVDAAQRYNDTGSVQSGGLTWRTEPAFDAIVNYTDIDDKVVYYRARAMTLYTGRRGVQTQLVSKAQRLGDWYLEALWTANDYSQLRVGIDELLSRDWKIVWENEHWRLWRIPD